MSTREYIDKLATEKLADEEPLTPAEVEKIDKFKKKERRKALAKKIAIGAGATALAAGAEAYGLKANKTMKAGGYKRGVRDIRQFVRDSHAASGKVSDAGDAAARAGRYVSESQEAFDRSQHGTKTEQSKAKRDLTRDKAFFERRKGEYDKAVADREKHDSLIPGMKGARQFINSKVKPVAQKVQSANDFMNNFGRRLSDTQRTMDAIDRAVKVSEEIDRLYMEKKAAIGAVIGAAAKVLPKVGAAVAKAAPKVTSAVKTVAPKVGNAVKAAAKTQVGQQVIQQGTGMAMQAGINKIQQKQAEKQQKIQQNPMA